ncbi:MAG: tail fiber protein [Mailhella sp.]|nr:tail fiber protein [Mailhella sp.]
MSDSIYVKVGDAVQQLDLGGNAPEYVQRIEALEAGLESGLAECLAAAQVTATGSVFGNVKLSDSTSSTSAASKGIAASPKAVKAAYDRATTAINSAAAKVATVNGLAPDSAGNVDVGGMPLGAAFPYTGSDVPAGTLRADGATYTNMAASFPAFYAWVQASGLAVPMASYALVEGSCGRYGLDESTGSVRMPTLAAGVFGASAASQYGQAVQAGLPNITGKTRTGGSGLGTSTSSLDYTTGAFALGAGDIGNVANGISGDGRELVFDASGSSPIYGRSDTVTPSHVKYPWVIVVYNAAVPASVAEAGEFVGLLDGKADKTSVEAIADYIVETYRNGSDWYEVYKSGKVRQGGLYDYGSASADITFSITLLKPYASTNYAVVPTAYKLQDSVSSRAVMTNIFYKTTTSFKAGWWSGGGASNVRYFEWIAEG